MLWVLRRSLHKDKEASEWIIVCICVEVVQSSLTHMCGFWKDGGVGLMESLDVGLTGGLAKISFRALRLPW